MIHHVDVELSSASIFVQSFHAHLNAEVSRRHSFWLFMWRIVNAIVQGGPEVRAVPLYFGIW
jgi:hypothetical protein